MDKNIWIDWENVQKNIELGCGEEIEKNISLGKGGKMEEYLTLLQGGCVDECNVWTNKQNYTIDKIHKFVTLL